MDSPALRVPLVATRSPVGPVNDDDFIIDREGGHFS